MPKKLKKCPQCGQQLRFPENIGGMLMACPTCGKTFASDFVVRSARSHSKGTGENEKSGEDVPHRHGGRFKVVV